MTYQPNKTTNKLNPKNIPYIFLNYPTLQKKYKLLNILNNKIFISKNIKFFKTIFPYNKTQNSPYLLPLPIQRPNSKTHNPNFYKNPIINQSYPNQSPTPHLPPLQNNIHPSPSTNIPLIIP